MHFYTNRNLMNGLSCQDNPFLIEIYTIMMNDT